MPKKQHTRSQQAYFSFILSLFIFNSNLLVSQQNLHENYSPLKSSGILPAIFTQNINEIIQTDINEASSSDTINKKIKNTYYSAVNYEIENKIKSGNTLINDEITVYVNELAKIILKNNTELKDKIKIYTSKSSVTNAFCYDKGFIFVNLGLIANVKSEAQLAFILCHEIAHYTKQHNISGYIQNHKLESSAEGKSDHDIFLERCQYSRKQETEADIEGLELYKSSNYDFKEAVDVFHILQYSHLPFELIEFKKSFFESDNFKIPEKYLLNEVSSIKDNSLTDDSESTHPNTASRKSLINNKIDSLDNVNRSKNILGEERFIYIRDIARFEVCKQHLKTRNYEAAIYSAYILAQKYPNNLFLIQTISKSLYAICLYRLGLLRYNKDSYLDGPIHYLEIETYPQQMYYLINKLPDTDWNLLSLNYTYRNLKKHNNDATLKLISDSLFSIMKYTNCYLKGFEKNSISNITGINTSSAYYSGIFEDLFETDSLFINSFPKQIGYEFNIPYEPKSYKVKDYSKKMRIVGEIDVAMSLEPFYIIFDSNENQIDYSEADNKKQKMINISNSCAKKENLNLIVLSPGLINKEEVDRMNDFSIVNDWLYERMDGKENEKSRVPVFNSDEINDVIKKYSTSHVLKTGFVVIKDKSPSYIFYTVIYDFNENREVFIKQKQYFGTLEEKNIEMLLCNLFHELKTGQINDK
jgi:hypothetical protein